MEIASFVKSLADRYRYGIDCIIDNNDLLALALSKMPAACIEPMESCNEGDESGITLTCEGGTIILDGQTVTTSQIINQVNVFGKGVIIANPELKTNRTLSASVKGAGYILEPELLRTSGTTTVTDIDGNTYNYVTIGDYDWFTSNLKVTKLNDNTSLTIHNTPNVTYTSVHYTNLWTWYKSEALLYSWYNNDSNENKNRGALYNKFSAMNPKICPDGWRLPTYEELNTMVINYNDRIRSTVDWTNPPIVPNPNGFNLKPNGYKIRPFGFSFEVLSKYNAKYFDQFNVASLWTTSQVIQLDSLNIIPLRPNIGFPTDIPGNTTTLYTDTTRGAYGTNLTTWTPYYAPNGNCIRCMRNKIN